MVSEIFTENETISMHGIAYNQVKNVCDACRALNLNDNREDIRVVENRCVTIEFLLKELLEYHLINNPGIHSRMLEIRNSGRNLGCPNLNVLENDLEIHINNHIKTGGKSE